MQFGSSVAIRGDLLAVGAIGASSPAGAPGWLLVYRRQGFPPTWQLRSSLADPTLGANPSRTFGFLLDIDPSGERIFVASGRELDGGLSQVVVHVLHPHPPQFPWFPEASLPISTPADNSFFFDPRSWLMADQDQFIGGNAGRLNGVDTG